MGFIKMFGLGYTRVQIPVQLVGKERYADTEHKKNRPGVTMRRRVGVGGGGGVDLLFKNGQ